MEARTAWRVEGTLREFPKFSPINLWFDYPIHRIDETGALKDIQPEAETPPWQRAMNKRKPREDRAKDRKESLEAAFAACDIYDKVTVQDLAEYMGVSEKTARRRIQEHKGFWIDGSQVGKKSGTKT